MEKIFNIKEVPVNIILLTFYYNMKYILHTLLLSTIFSCSTHVPGEELRIVELAGCSTSIQISDFVDSVDYLFFNFNGTNTVLGEIVDAKILGNELIVREKNGQISMFQRFTLNGNYLNEIGDFGRGPNELYNPRDIAVYNGDYIVWDYRGIHQISKSGNYLKYLFDARIPGSSFFIDSTYIYFFHELMAPGLISKYSISGSLEKVYNPHDYNFGHLNYASVGSISQDSFHIMSPIIDTVYSFNPKKEILKPLLVFDGGIEKTFQKVLIESANLQPLDQLKYINKEKPVQVQTYLENNNFLLIGYRKNRQLNYYLHNKKRHTTKYFKDPDNSIWGIPLLLTNDNMLYLLVQPQELNKNLILRSKELQQNLKNNINNNPFFVRCKLKE